MHMTDDSRYDLLCIGNYTKDTIISPMGTKYVDGGAMNYSAHAAARLGLRTAVVTHLAREDKRVIDKFTQAGIDCYYSYTVASTCMKLVYPTHDPDLRTLSVTSTAQPISAQDVADIDTRAAVIGSSYRGEVGIDVIRALRQKNIFLGVDMQGFVRVLRKHSLVYEAWTEMESVLPLADVVKSDAVEAQHLTGESDLYQAARAFASLGPREVVLTHRDGILIYNRGECRRLNFYASQLDGRSGRGDTCIGAYMAMRSSLDPFHAAQWAAAVTSLKMERLGPFDRPLSDVHQLLISKYSYGPEGLAS